MNNEDETLVLHCLIDLKVKTNYISKAILQEIPCLFVTNNFSNFSNIPLRKVSAIDIKPADKLYYILL